MLKVLKDLDNWKKCIIFALLNRRRINYDTGEEEQGL